MPAATSAYRSATLGSPKAAACDSAVSPSAANPASVRSHHGSTPGAGTGSPGCQSSYRTIALYPPWEQPLPASAAATVPTLPTARAIAPTTATNREARMSMSLRSSWLVRPAEGFLEEAGVVEGPTGCARRRRRAVRHRDPRAPDARTRLPADTHRDRVGERRVLEVEVPVEPEVALLGRVQDRDVAVHRAVCHQDLDPAGPEVVPVGVDRRVRVVGDLERGVIR